MKKEDMKKRCKEGKPGLKTGIINFNLLFFFFQTFQGNLFPQIPINGFCKYNSFKADTGYTNLIASNFNNDAYSDFILYNPAKKKIAALTGSYQGEITTQKEYALPYGIFSLQPLNNKTSSLYLFTSRTKRKAGLYQLNAQGKPTLLTEINFDSYPDHLNSSDVNADGKNEILISGGAFNGISLLYQADGRFTEKNIADKNPFSQAVFIDITNDGFNDIAAYDIVKGAFNFFYNNGIGQFREARTLSFAEKPSGIKTFDLNLDSYEDIIFAAGNSINIWYGDFRSSYENTKKIHTRYKPDKYIYGDFNRDGLIDIAYLNFDQSLISLLFAKNELDYYPEIIYLQQSGLRDIIPYYSRFINGFAALSDEGVIHTITNLSSFADEVSISLGAKPKAISFFDNENNGITDICFIDEYDKKIKFVTRDNTGLPLEYFSQQLFEDHEKIIPVNTKKNEKNFICFSYNKKLIEVVRADLYNNRITKNVLYSPGLIADLKVKQENNGTYKIFIAYVNEKSLSLGVFNNNNDKFTFSKLLVDNVNPYDASIAFGNSLNIIYWAKKDDKIMLLKKEIGKAAEIPVEQSSIKKNDNLSITSFTGDLLNMEKDIAFSFINEDTNSYIVITADTFTSIINRKSLPGGFRITSKNNLFFGEIRFNGLKKFSFYLPGQNVINKIEFVQKGKNIVSTKLSNTSKIGSFFIKNMTSKNYHLVYTDLDKKCITIKRIEG